MKVCRICNKSKDESEFSSHSATRDRLLSLCKECDNIISKKWYINNREHAIKKRKKWQEDNMELHKEHCRKYVENNKERVKESRMKYYHRKRAQESI